MRYGELRMFNVGSLVYVERSLSWIMQTVDNACLQIWWFGTKCTQNPGIIRNKMWFVMYFKHKKNIERVLFKCFVTSRLLRVIGKHAWPEYFYDTTKDMNVAYSKQHFKNAVNANKLQNAPSGSHNQVSSQNWCHFANLAQTTFWYIAWFRI